MQLPEQCLTKEVGDSVGIKQTNERTNKGKQTNNNNKTHQKQVAPVHYILLNKPGRVTHY